MFKAFKKILGGGGISVQKSNFAEFEKLENREFLSVSPSVPREAKIKVKNLFGSNGISLNESLVKVPFTLGIRIADASKIAVRGYVFDPHLGHQRKVIVNILSIAVDPSSTNYLNITTDTLMRKTGGKILFNAGALTDTKSRPVTPVEVSSPQGQNKERFTLARRSFVPVSPNLFSNDIYAAASAPTPASSHVSASTVLTNFTAFMNKKVVAGTITQATENTALTQFNNATVKSIIPDANLRAATLSLYGTVGEPAIAAMLDGQNMTGKPQTVIDFSTELSQSAEVAETLVLQNGRLRTLFRTSFAGEPFEALSTWVAHEALHQDADAGQNEAIATNVVETMVWSQQLMTDSSYVNSNTELVKAENDKLLAMLNSGSSAVFPRVGMEQAPGHNEAAGVFPGEQTQTGGPYVSYEDYIRRLYIARGFGTNSSAGNPTLDAMMNNITSLGKTYSQFNTTEFADVDKNQLIITDKTAISLGEILRLTVT